MVDDAPRETDLFATFGAARPPADDLDLARLDAEVRARLFGGEPTRVHVGRYALLDRLGAGAMGEVWSAHDPVLDRRVALKLLHARGDADARARLLAEAQAIARLSHPNVVSVYEVGIDGARDVYLAMELVVGICLDRWLLAGRTRSETLAMFVAAGRGLAAAHDAGLVHRDFKPANVIVGDDGRPRVVDFGLASDVAGASRDGVVVGTPAYMAPEQHVGGAVDARADVYAASVALFEALAGSLPFPGTTQAEIAEAKRAGPSSALDRALLHAPRWLRAIVAHGLAVDPAERPSMAAWVDALERTPIVRRRWSIAVAAGVALGAAAWAGARIDDSHAEHCDGVGDTPEWNDARRAELLAELSASPLPTAPDVATTVTERLDLYAQRLATARVEACRAGGRQAHGSAVAMRCLDDRERELAVAIDTLSVTDRGTAARALELVSSFERPESCAAEATWPTQSPEADAIADQIARAHAFTTLARFDDAREIITRARDAAAALGSQRLLARALRLEGILSRKLGDPIAAESQLRAGIVAARRAEDPVLEARIFGALGEVVGHVQGRTAEGLWWAELADAAIAPLDVDASIRASLLAARGEVHLRERLAGPARADFLDALALVEDDPDYVDRPYLLQRIGDAAAEANDLVEAEQYLREAIRVGTRMFGAEHPTVAWAMNNLGGVLFARGDYDGGEAMLVAALAVRRAVWGERHAEIAASLNNIAAVTLARGHADAAEPLQREALTMVESIYGVDHHKSASYRANLGEVLSDQGRFAEAEPLLVAALADRRRLLGTTHPDVAWSLVGLARLANRQGDVATAAARLDELAAQFPTVPASLETELAFERARLARRRGELPGARAILEAAMASEASPVLRAELELELGFVRVDDREAARRHAIHARDAYLRAGVGGEKLRAAEDLARG